MPTNHERVQFKRCQEKLIGTCNCCAIMPCRICLFVTRNGEEDEQHGDAELNDDNEYVGFVDGFSVRLVWEGDPQTDSECEFVVYVDDVEMARFQKCGYEPVDCRCPMGEIEFEDGYDLVNLRWECYEPIQLPRQTYLDDPPYGTLQECHTDVVFVVDRELTSFADGLQDVSNAAASIVSQLQAENTTYRIALITHRAPFVPVGSSTLTSIETLVPFADNNGQAFIDALTQLVSDVSAEITATGALVVYPNRRSHAALQAVLDYDMGAWSDKARKTVILTSGGTPSDFSGSSGADSVAALQLSAAGLNAEQVTVHTWNIPFTQSQTVDFPNPHTQTLIDTAANGGGSYVQQLSEARSGTNPWTDGTDALIAPNCFVPDAQTRIKCRKAFCPGCECIFDRLCINATSSNFDYLSCNVDFESTTSPYDCTDTSLTWIIDGQCPTLEISGTAIFERNEYGLCQMRVNLFGEERITIIDDCNNLLISETYTHPQDSYETITITITGGTCGCQGPPLPCCPGFEIPGTMTVTILDPNNRCVCFPGGITVDMSITFLNPDTRVVYRGQYQADPGCMGAASGDEVWLDFIFLCGSGGGVQLQVDRYDVSPGEERPTNDNGGGTGQRTLVDSLSSGIDQDCELPFFVFGSDNAGEIVCLSAISYLVTV